MKKYIANILLDIDGYFSDYNLYSKYIEPRLYNLKVWAYENED